MVKEWSGPYLGIERGLADLKLSKEQQIGGQEMPLEYISVYS